MSAPRPASDTDAKTRRRDFWLHVSLFVVVNAIYLTLAWPLWLWVTAFWTVGLGVHASLAFGPSLAQATRRTGRAGRRDRDG